MASRVLEEPKRRKIVQVERALVALFQAVFQAVFPGRELPTA